MAHLVYFMKSKGNKDSTETNVVSLLIIYLPYTL